MSNDGSELNRRQFLGAMTSSGFALGSVTTAATSVSSAASPGYSESYKSCSGWEFAGSFCPASSKHTMNMSALSNQVCWTDGECRQDGWYTRDCCYNPPKLTKDSRTDTVWIVGEKHEANLNTLFSQASEWYSVDPDPGVSYYGVQFIIHSGATLVETSSNEPGNWINSFNTNVSIGQAEANLTSYTNPNDPANWIGATDNLDRYTGYGISDYLFETAGFMLSWVPYLGKAISIGQYAHSMDNMLNYTPGTGVSINFDYPELNDTSKFSQWARITLDQMDPGQTVTIDVSETADPGFGETNNALTVQAPSGSLDSAVMSKSELERQGLQRTTVGEIRRNPSQYRIVPPTNLSNDTVITIGY